MNLEYLWSERWVGRYEGFASLAWKFAYVNCSESIALGTTTRSLKTFGSRQEPADLTPSQLPIMARVGERDPFRRFAPHQDVMVAQPYLKYCPHCLIFGYVSVFHQLACLVRCPIHDVKLANRCIGCGKPTPTVDIATAVSKTPFRCSHCARPYSGLFDPNLFFEADERIHAYEQAFDAIADWTDRLCKPRRGTPDLERGLQYCFAEATEGIKRTVVGWYLRGLEPLDAPERLLGGRPIPVASYRFQKLRRKKPLDSRFELWPKRYYELYGAIRRHFRRRIARSPGGSHVKHLLTGFPLAPPPCEWPLPVRVFIQWRAAIEWTPDVFVGDQLGNLRFNQYCAPCITGDDGCMPLGVWARFLVGVLATCLRNEIESKEPGPEGPTELPVTPAFPHVLGEKNRFVLLYLSYPLTALAAGVNSATGVPRNLPFLRIPVPTADRRQKVKAFRREKGLEPRYLSKPYDEVYT